MTKENYQDGIRDSNEMMIDDLNELKPVGAFAAVQQFVEPLKQVRDSIMSAVHSESMKTLINVGERIAELIASVDFTHIIKKFSEAMIPIRYICLLERLKWPIFLINDKKLREDIMCACDDEDDIEAVRDIIFNYCAGAFLKAMQEDWNLCEIIRQERKPVLFEAIQMHEKGYYYSSTSLLMCQVYGVASDIVDLIKKENLELDDKGKDFISKFFKIERDKIDNEKGKLMQMLAITENGLMLWKAMLEYLKNEILCSSESKKRWATQPVRNKICHGDQLNFGTKEHSLKAILTIDMLIQLSYEIKRISELRSDIVTEDVRN